MSGSLNAPQKVVIDTNIALDVLLFQEPAVQVLKADLQAGKLHWLATPAMRDELERVLAYKQILPRLAFYKLDAAQVLAAYDAQVQWRPVAAKTTVVCKDADDQRYLDLAVAEQAWLLSKDRQVLKCRKRLARLGADISANYPLPSPLTEAQRHE